MPLETATYIYSLVTTNPDATDSRTTGDNHLRLIKSAVKRTFPNLDGEVSASHSIVNTVAFTGLRTNAEATISSTHVVRFAPRQYRDGVFYNIGPVYAFKIDAEASVSPWRAGWSATYSGSGQYRLFHPLAKNPATGSLVAIVSSMAVARRPTHLATSATGYISYSVRNGNGADTDYTTGAVQVIVMVP